MKFGNERPINGNAARVDFSRGEHFDYQPHARSSDSALPLPIRPITPELIANPQFQDLTGMTIGRLRVVGLSAEKTGRWVCRCVCGAYVLRKAIGLKTGSTASAPCDQCYLLALAKKQDVFRRTGKQKGTEDFLK
jgi:hypothetical protein